jgi:hypothetical protein
VLDERNEAYAELIDRLLASEQYGVKQGRHWLDLVRYAETNSFERDSMKPAVWRYRDWVVDAHNRDLPYGDFLTRQLAGDEIEGGGVEALVATGFYRLGLWDDEPTEPLQAVYDDYDSIADTAARSMLGISMGCARCHDHKKDPITTKDYYSFLSFFEGVAPYRPPYGGTALSVDNYLRSVPPDGAAAEFEKARGEFAAQHASRIARARDAAASDYAQLSASARVDRLTNANRSLVARYSLERSDAVKWIDDVGERHGAVGLRAHGPEGDGQAESRAQQMRHGMGQVAQAKGEELRARLLKMQELRECVLFRCGKMRPFAICFPIVGLRHHAQGHMRDPQRSGVAPQMGHHLRVEAFDAERPRIVRRAGADPLGEAHVAIKAALDLADEGSFAANQI